MLKVLRALPVRVGILTKVFSSLMSRGFALGKLSEYEKFILFGGDEIIWAQKPTGAVLVLGGYTGQSSVRYAETSSQVVSLEPVEVFRAQMLARAVGVNNLICLDFAASNENGVLALNLGGDGTSAIRRVGTNSIEVDARDIAEIVDEYGPFELLECNIEGGEYSVIPRLCETKAVNNVEKLLIQFHDVGPESADYRLRAHKQLSRTHLRVWNYDWVWELWVKM